MAAFSVNNVLDHLNELDGRVVTVYGVLSLEFEGTCLSHVPRSETRLKEAGEGLPSSIWVEFAQKQFAKKGEWLQQFDGRHVQITGRLQGPCEEFGGCGHFSLWSAALHVTAVEKYSREVPESER